MPVQLHSLSLYDISVMATSTIVQCTERWQAGSWTESLLWF
jgi:hypothetical protein